ncbi:MAG: hypothetical protein DRM98_00270 [Thermoplasmata archaeon]|nr:MAG: hypothetical protein DRM98_00270 [Thermoplasmata archaeon]
MDEEKREYIALLREGYIDKEQFMELMRAANSPAPSKKKPIKKQFTFRFPSVLKKAVPVAVSILLLFSVLTFITPVSRAASPVVAYSSISNGEQFVDVIPGEGVYLTVNVSDSDGNLQSVDIYTNASGSWSSIYSSGSLGGVSYHNTSSFLVSSWTGSWTKYWFNITANDGSDTEFVYSFTTEYVFGKEHAVAVNDSYNYYYPSILKNSTNDYWIAWLDYDSYALYTIHDTAGTAFAIKNKLTADPDVRNVWGSGYKVMTRDAYLYIYNNSPHIAYADDYSNSDWAYYYTIRWNGNAWVDKTKTTITHMNADILEGTGISIIYFDGKWNTFLSHTYSYASNWWNALTWYYGTYPFATSYSSNIESISSYDHDYFPSTQILNGKLILVYHDTGDDLHWQVYDGVSWNDKGDIELDIGEYGCSIVKDPVNNQIVLVYVNSSGNMYYRILTDPTGSWSSPHLLFTPASGKTIKHPYIAYIDHRIVIVCSYNLRGNYNIYMISAPDYVESVSGFNTTYNRIQWVDAAPNANNVNSTVVSFKNMNDRDIKNVTWHFEDIGDISVANNIRVWSNMSGSWQSWSVGSDGNTSKIDISTVKGSEWQPGETLYWKFEILNVGNVVEDLHATDEDIYMLIEF